MAAGNYLAFSQYEDMSTASFGLYRPDGELIEIIYEHGGDFKMHETGMFFVGEEEFGVIILPAGSETEQSIRVSGVLSNPSGSQISDWIGNHGAILGLAPAGGGHGGGQEEGNSSLAPAPTELQPMNQIPDDLNHLTGSFSVKIKWNGDTTMSLSTERITFKGVNVQWDDVTTSL